MVVNRTLVLNAFAAAALLGVVKLHGKDFIESTYTHHDASEGVCQVDTKTGIPKITDSKTGDVLAQGTLSQYANSPFASKSFFSRTGATHSNHGISVRKDGRCLVDGMDMYAMLNNDS